MQDLKNRRLDFVEIPFSDVTFKIDGREIHAHRCIIALKCEYFRAMFSVPMKESQTREIEIRETSYDAFYKVLQYIYCDELVIDLITESHLLEEIIRLADMYDLKEVRIILLRIYDSYIDSFEVMFPKIAHISFFTDLIVSDLITRWSDIDNREQFSDILVDSYPNLAKKLLSRMIGGFDVERVRGHLKHLGYSDTEEFLASERWKNFDNFREYLDAKGECLPSFMTD